MFGRFRSHGIQRRPPVVKPGPDVKPNPKPNPVPPKVEDKKPGNPVVKPGPDVMPKPNPLPPKKPFKKGGSVDGCAKRGKTKGKMV